MSNMDLRASMEHAAKKIKVNQLGQLDLKFEPRQGAVP